MENGISPSLKGFFYILYELCEGVVDFFRVFVYKIFQEIVESLLNESNDVRVVFHRRVLVVKTLEIEELVVEIPI